MDHHDKSAFQPSEYVWEDCDSCGGLIEVHQQTKDLSVLKEAKIKVGASNISDIPQTFDQALGGSRFTIHLSSLLTLKKCILY